MMNGCSLQDLLEIHTPYAPPTHSTHTETHTSHTTRTIYTPHTLCSAAQMHRAHAYMIIPCICCFTPHMPQPYIHITYCTHVLHTWLHRHTPYTCGSTPHSHLFADCIRSPGDTTSTQLSEQIFVTWQMTLVLKSKTWRNTLKKINKPTAARAAMCIPLDQWYTA